MSFSNQLEEARKGWRLLAEGAWFRLYRDPENSEVDEEENTLAAILKFKASKDAEIIQNGRTMANASPNGRKWVLTARGKKEPK